MGGNRLFGACFVWNETLIANDCMGCGGKEMLEKIKQIAKETTMTESGVASSLLSNVQQGLPLNLQYFAESDDSGDSSSSSDNVVGDNNGNNDDDSQDNDNNQDEDKETFTKSELDRKVSLAIEAFKKNQEPKQQQAIDEAVQQAIEEKERLSNLSEKERKEEEMSQREKKIAEREAEIERKTLRSEAVDDLQGKGLPGDFADFLLADNAENTLNNINVFKDTFDKAVNESVKERLRQETPGAGTGEVEHDPFKEKLSKYK